MPISTHDKKLGKRGAINYLPDKKN